MSKYNMQLSLRDWYINTLIEHRTFFSTNYVPLLRIEVLQVDLIKFIVIQNFLGSYALKGARVGDINCAGVDIERNA